MLYRNQKARKKLYILLSLVFCGVLFSFYGIKQKSATVSSPNITLDGFGYPNMITSYELSDGESLVASRMYVHEGLLPGDTMPKEAKTITYIAYTGVLQIRFSSGGLSSFVRGDEFWDNDNYFRLYCIEEFDSNSSVARFESGEEVSKQEGNITKTQSLVSGAIRVSSFHSAYSYYLATDDSALGSKNAEDYTYTDIINNKNLIKMTNDSYSLPEDLKSHICTVFAFDNEFHRVAYSTVSVPVLDYTCPDINVSYDVSPKATVGGVHYYSEESFASEQLGADVTLMTFDLSDNGTLASASATSSALKNTITCSSSYKDSSGKAAVKIKPKADGSTDGQTNIVVATKDSCNNETVCKDVVVYDSQLPRISGVNINGKTYENAKRLFNEDITFEFDVTEANLKSVAVYVDDVKVSENDINIENTGGNVHHCALTLSDEFKGKIRVVVTDMVGHTGTFETADELEIDKTPLDVSSVTMNGKNIKDESGLFFNASNYEFVVVPDALDIASIDIVFSGFFTEESVVPLTESNGSYVGSTVLPEGSYSLVVEMRDLAGNASSVKMESFVTDTTAPAVTLKRDGEHFKFTLVEKYLDDVNAGDVTITCRDLYNTVGDIEFKLNGKTQSGSLTFVQSLLADKLNWKEVEGSADTYTLDFELITNGKYEYSLVIQDKAGNSSRKISGSICYDTKEPDFTRATFDVEKKEFKDYGYIANRTIGLEIVGSDEVSGIKQVIVHYTNNDGKKIEGECELKEGTDDTFLYFFGKKECEKGFIDSISLTDNNGNTRIVEFKNGIIIDKETADVELLDLQIADDANGKVVLNRDLGLTLSIKDSYSGIASYEYTVNGKKKAGNGDTKKIEYSKTIRDTIVAAQNEGDDIVVELTATDNAGNSKTVRKKYSFDTTKPTIKVTYDSKTDNNYYKETRTATVSITDAHFSDKGVTFAITNNGNKIDVSPKFSTTDDKVFTASIALVDEGIYSVGLTATDRAGNQAVFTDGTLFTIDKTAPKMTISYDDSRASNSKYFNQTRVATVLVDELNFDDSLVNLNIEATGGGRAPQLTSFSNSSIHHTANLSFAVDGNYVISGTVTDKAGNVSEEVVSPEFTIDTKQPEITFSNVEEGHSYNGDITPVCTITDTNYDSGEVESSGVKYGKHTELNLSSTKSKEGETFTYATFERQLRTDDAYTVKVTARDLAGNTKEESISFKVNRFGSRYSLDEYTSEAVKQYYVNSENDFVIVEDNLDKVNNYELCYISDGATKVLDYGEDYTITSSSDSSGWNTYSYSIKPTMLEKDGFYSFVVYSTDAAGNKSDNITKGTPLKVCVDDTAPIITVSNLEDTGVYRVKEMKAKVVITDNLAYDKAVVKLNDKEYEVAESEFDIDLTESKKEQTLEVVAIDKAGNAVTTDIYTFVVDSTASENAKVKSRRESERNVPVLLIVVCCIPGVIIIGLGVTAGVLAFKRRKHEKVQSTEHDEE